MTILTFGTELNQTFVDGPAFLAYLRLHDRRGLSQQAKAHGRYVAGEGLRLKDAGICYVANTASYVDEAMQSVASVRAVMPDVPIAMMTHRELFRNDPRITDWVELKQDRFGPIVKTGVIDAPYERVLFLDSDTMVIGDLGELFDLVRDGADFAAAIEPNAHPEYGMEAGVPMLFPEPNSGVFAFRKSAAMRRMFDVWLAEYEVLHAARGVAADQPSLRTALWKSRELRFVTLGREYNLITHANCSVSGAIKVVHDRSPERDRLGRIVNEQIVARAIVSGYGPVYGFGGRRQWMRQHLRLTYNFLRILFRPGNLRQQGFPVIWWRDGID